MYGLNVGRGSRTPPNIIGGPYNHHLLLRIYNHVYCISKSMDGWDEPIIQVTHHGFSGWKSFGPLVETKTKLFVATKATLGALIFTWIFPSDFKHVLIGFLKGGWLFP